MCTAITNASDTPALETLYTYTEQEDGTTTRPLGEIPNLDQEIYNDGSNNIASKHIIKWI